MSDINRVQIRSAKRACLRPGRGHEFRSGHRNRRYPESLEFCCVVQTARRARTSVGKRFDYRHHGNLSELLATAHFRNPRHVGTGNIYDVQVYEKGPA